MYDDYPIAGYNSTVNQFVWLQIIGIIIVLLILVVTMISIMKVFKKANRKGILALIPIYNIIILLEICNLPIMYLVFLLIPGVNLIFSYKLSITLASLFKKDKLFGIGLFVFPIIFYPILGFSKSEYVGINIIGMESNYQVNEIPVIDELKNKEIEVEVNEEVDEASKNINISLGGGIYQKDYAKNLTNIEDDDRVIRQGKKEKEKEKVPVENILLNPNIAAEIEGKMKEEKIQEIPQEEKKTTDLFHVDFIETPKTNPEPIEETVSESTFIPNEVPTIEETKEEVVTPNSVIELANQVLDTPNNESKEEHEEITNCPGCGTKIVPGTKICFVCGKQLI